jgi:tRNA guanosine-2'-O-methyltransferase
MHHGITVYSRVILSHELSVLLIFFCVCTSLYIVSSLMIIGGNLMVGRYASDFLNVSEIDTNQVLAGALPWLGGTQGFVRAIAQLLVHNLIPMIINVNNDGTGAAAKGTSTGTPPPKQPNSNTSSNDWYLGRVWRFLEENQDMARLRVKQQGFFEAYDVDAVCTPEGLLTQIPVDDGTEACPLYLVNDIKRCLIESYFENRPEVEDSGSCLEDPKASSSSWKPVEELLQQQESAIVGVGTTSDGANSNATFQRKIMPLDALNLTLEQSSVYSAILRNAAGRNKQDMIVCASLIDKVPNLAGLARTAEIFACSKLVVPDARVQKMDNFKTISVGANDWIDIEECKEENLLPWLYQKKQEGYTIVGLEQTSSSQCLSSCDFPSKTVLLLGKEKEGIPVYLLHTVDICVEIPQMGIIRSLNVHVSGAITIWEYTKQQLQKTTTMK